MSALQQKVAAGLRGEVIESRSLYSKMNPAKKMQHHKYMHKYHSGEVKHHKGKMEALKARITANPQNTEWNKDYHKAMSKHQAFHDYHKKQMVIHSRHMKGM